MESSGPLMTPGKPSVLKYAQTLIALQTLRLIGLSLIPLFQNGTLPRGSVISTAFGDGSTAIFAPVIGMLLGEEGRRPGLLVSFGTVSDWQTCSTRRPWLTSQGWTPIILENDFVILFGAYLAAILHVVTFIFLLEKGTITISSSVDRQI